jgi:hypothetical protein
MAFAWRDARQRNLEGSADIQLLFKGIPISFGGDRLLVFHQR